MTGRYAVRAGEWDQGGATVTPDGVNFSVFSRYADQVELLLFEHADSATAFQTVVLDPRVNRTFVFWHVFVAGLPEGTFYNWRVRGTDGCGARSSRLDGDKALLDPWATTVSDRLWNRARACGPGDNLATAMRARVTRDDYDWEGDQPIHVPLNNAVIYELHVGGFTRHPASGTRHSGTFPAIIEKVPYLSDLGITHVELMPVMAFDPQDVPPHTARLGLENYWGYSTHSFFAPHPHFAVEPARARDEFRDMVKALHRAGIGVILDVVFNHTAEGNEEGPTIHFKALGNETFYHIDFADPCRYRDYTGCGNTVNCNHPMVTRFLVDSLLYWVREMHVDGFRFDLASALARGEDGEPQYHAPVLWATELSPALSRSHLIAEAWDAAGLYQVGDFPGYRWAEWNGRYRDVIRAFVKGEPGLIAEVASRIAGSSDLYQPRGRLPVNSINFVTCHDGFSLWDLVSYDKKHNEANGEDNRDGHDHNLSWNCGVEGPTDDPGINTLRRRQARNFVAILMLSQGVPMLLSGDEVLATRNGNNNPYCQNNEISWIDWSLLDKNRAMLDFVRGAIALRRRHPALTRDRFLTGQPGPNGGMPDVAWHGSDLGPPDWSNPHARALAFTLAGVTPDEPPLHVIINMADEPRAFALPPLDGRRWHWVMDTADEKGLLNPDEHGPITEDRVTAASRSVLVLEALTS